MYNNTTRRGIFFFNNTANKAHSRSFIRICRRCIFYTKSSTRLSAFQRIFNYIHAKLFRFTYFTHTHFLFNTFYRILFFLRHKVLVIHWYTRIIMTHLISLANFRVVENTIHCKLCYCLQSVLLSRSISQLFELSLVCHGNCCYPTILRWRSRVEMAVFVSFHRRCVSLFYQRRFQ